MLTRKQVEQFRLGFGTDPIAELCKSHEELRELYESALCAALLSPMSFHTDEPICERNAPDAFDCALL